MSTAWNQWQHAAQQEEVDLEDYSVEQLKALLEEKGLPKTGNKTELIERLRESE